MEFLPFVQMAVRVDKAKQDSDTTYFNDLLLYGELILKTCVLGFIGALVDDKDRQKFSMILKRMTKKPGDFNLK